MSTQEIITRLNELGDWAIENQWELPFDLPNVLYRAAATIEVLRSELRHLIETK